MTSFDRLLRQMARPLICSSVLVLITALSAAAQTNNKADATARAVTKKANAAEQKLKDATQQGIPLTHANSTDVTSNISVEATLIPASIAKTVFGKEIANNYAVISLTISNRSSDDAFIVHSIFIDYSQWLLGGGSPFKGTNALCLRGTQEASSSASTKSTPSLQQLVRGGAASPPPSGESAIADKGAAPKEGDGQNTNSSQSQAAQNSTSQSCTGNELQTSQQQTLPNQIASVEGRIVREELLIKQPWTTRNWVLRALESAGSIATGFTFATSSQSWIQGIGAFNGSVIPGYKNFWPDATVSQINQISNVGFQVNKAIAKQSSDIVVAFFPIDRFLTPDLQSLFISSPAAFFSPVAALLDPKTHGRLEPYMFQIFRGQENEQALFGNMLKFLPQFGTGACEQYEGSLMPLDASLLNSTDKDSPKSTSSSQNSFELACLMAAVVNRLSLNTIRLTVGGTMTVDVNSVPPQIASVDIEPPSEETTSSMWGLKTSSKSATLNGTIHGSFLGGATPTLVSPPSGITIKGVAEGSTDTALQFTLTLTSNLPEGTKQLTFQVSKSSSSGSTFKSASYDYQIEETAATTSPQESNGKAPSTANPAPFSTPEKPTAPAKK